MRLAMLYLAIAAIVAPSCKRSPAAITKEEAIAIIEQFDKGWRNKDKAAVDAALAPTYLYFTQSGGTFSRDSVVATAGSPAYVLDEMDRKEYDIQLYGNTAVVSTRWRGKGMYYGPPFNEDQRCSIAIIKLNNSIQIISEHCTPVKQVRIFH